MDWLIMFGNEMAEDVFRKACPYSPNPSVLLIFIDLWRRLNFEKWNSSEDQKYVESSIKHVSHYVKDEFEGQRWLIMKN